MVKGDVTLRYTGAIEVVITAEDQQREPGVIDMYLCDDYEIVKDEREMESDT